MLAAVDARGPNWTEREPGEEGAVLTARCVLGLVAKRLRSFQDPVDYTRDRPDNEYIPSGASVAGCETRREAGLCVCGGVMSRVVPRPVGD